MAAEKLFEAALGIERPWYVAGVEYDESAKVLSVRIDFAPGSRFAAEDVAGEHPVHDTVTKTYRHLNFFQHECYLLVRTPRVKLPDGAVQLVKPPFAGMQEFHDVNRGSLYRRAFTRRSFYCLQHQPLAAGAIASRDWRQKMA